VLPESPRTTGQFQARQLSDRVDNDKTDLERRWRSTAAVNRCDVIIVNYNAGGFLPDAVQSVLRSPSVAHVYVVDNGSTDESLSLLPRDQGDRLTIIRNGANLGFAAGCNVGLKQAAASNILVLNPDCQMSEGAIERLITILRSADRIGMVGPHLLNPDGSEQAGGRRRLPTPSLVLFRALGLRRVLPMHLPDYLLHQDPVPPNPIEVEAISGACMMARREMITDIGPLDEQYFLHVEDLDWCMRAHRAGWKILFVPDAKVVHQKGVSSQVQPLTVEYYKHKGMVRFYGKLLDETRSRWLLALVAAGVWTRFGGIATQHLLSRGAERTRNLFR
jgi:GT2 family glycosyltransferase